jgi:electron transfer flavoprotein beta subunit
MKILVPIKRVVDPYAKVRPTADGTGLDTTGLKFEINPFDEIAVEEAVRLRERLGDVEIVVISIGPEECEEQLRKALAMGADRAILVESSLAYDPPAIAAELAEQVRKFLSPDLILMGKQATDDDANQVGQMLAALLDYPQATFAAKLEISRESARVTRETDTGEETVEVSLPAVVTVDLRLNEPRYIALPGIIKARSKPLERRAPILEPKPRIRIVKYETPPARSSGLRVGSVDELFAALKSKGAI